MIYDLTQAGKLEEAHDTLYEFASNGKTIELKIHRPKRTNPQNRALHLLLGYFSNQTGYTLRQAKERYKDINTDIYDVMLPTMNEDDVWKYRRSSTELDTKEMAKSIDKLYLVCSEWGIELPKLENEAEMLSLENEIEKNSFYN